MRIPLAAVAALALLAGCHQKTESASSEEVAGQAEKATQAKAVRSFHGSNIAAENLGGDFTLTGGDNQPFRLSSLKGKVVLLSFGYSHCPDVCPTGLATDADVLKQLGERAKDVAVVFVSVDPERDTPELIGKYVKLFDNRFIGLSTAKGQDIEQVKKSFRVVSTKVPQAGGGYSVDHSAGTYLLDKDGKTAVYEPYGKTATEIADDVKILLK